MGKSQKPEKSDQRGELDANAFEAAYAGWLADGSTGEEAPQMLRAGKKPSSPRLSVVNLAVPNAAVAFEEPGAEALQMPREILF